MIAAAHARAFTPYAYFHTLMLFDLRYARQILRYFATLLAARPFFIAVATLP